MISASWQRGFLGCVVTIFAWSYQGSLQVIKESYIEHITKRICIEELFWEVMQWNDSIAVPQEVLSNMASQYIIRLCMDTCNGLPTEVEVALFIPFVTLGIAAKYQIVQLQLAVES